MQRMQRIGLTLLIMLIPLLVKFPEMRMASWEGIGLAIVIVVGCILFWSEW